LDYNGKSAITILKITVAVALAIIYTIEVTVFLEDVPVFGGPQVLEVVESHLDTIEARSIQKLNPDRGRVPTRPLRPSRKRICSSLRLSRSSLEDSPELIESGILVEVDGSVIRSPNRNQSGRVEDVHLVWEPMGTHERNALRRGKKNSRRSNILRRHPLVTIFPPNVVRLDSINIFRFPHVEMPQDQIHWGGRRSDVGEAEVKPEAVLVSGEWAKRLRA
jgi:hypothetical protein